MLICLLPSSSRTYEKLEKSFSLPKKFHASSSENEVHSTLTFGILRINCLWFLHLWDVFHPFLVETRDDFFSLGKSFSPFIMISRSNFVLEWNLHECNPSLHFHVLRIGDQFFRFYMVTNTFVRNFPPSRSLLVCLGDFIIYCEISPQHNVVFLNRRRLAGVIVYQPPRSHSYKLIMFIFFFHRLGIISNKEEMLTIHIFTYLLASCHLLCAYHIIDFLYNDQQNPTFSAICNDKDGEMENFKVKSCSLHFDLLKFPLISSS